MVFSGFWAFKAFLGLLSEAVFSPCEFIEALIN
jgi:hypothetical protein